jgi:hypothetical protein
MDAPRTAAAGVGQRSKIPAPVQASLEAKLAQLEEIRRKRLEVRVGQAFDPVSLASGI